MATIIPTPTPNIDVSDWRTYRNEEFGFEIKYPKEYESNEDYAIWTLTNKGGVLSEWGVNKRQETVFGIDVYLKNEKTRLLNHFGNETVADQQFFINDIAAKKLEGGKTAWNVLMIENENYIYIIISSFFPFKNNQEYNEYKAILSTFKFTEKDKTIDWETYRNEKHGFEIKYPQDWQYKKTYSNIEGVSIKMAPKKYSYYDSLGHYGFEITVIANKIRSNFTAAGELLSSFESVYGSADDILNIISNCGIKTKINISGKDIDFCEVSVVYDERYNYGLVTEKDNNAYMFTMQYFGDYQVEENADMAKIGTSALEGNGVKKAFQSVFANEYNTFNKIISTFKFTEKKGIAEWSTYTNKEYYFELKYPEIFILKSPTQDDKDRGTVLALGTEDGNDEGGGAVSVTIEKEKFDMKNVKSPAEEMRYTPYVLIDGVQSYIMAGGDGPCGFAYVAIPRDNYYIRLVFSDCGASDSIVYSANDYRDQILSTFKFTK
ncbi:hypothetical protein KJ854_01055 [Patescibacteria group bacterium]|nr:hypothetical protein [Patescibacteria group bacterium]